MSSAEGRWQISYLCPPQNLQAHQVNFLMPCELCASPTAVGLCCRWSWLTPASTAHYLGGGSPASWTLCNPCYMTRLLSWVSKSARHQRRPSPSSWVSWRPGLCQLASSGGTSLSWRFCAADEPYGDGSDFKSQPGNEATEITKHLLSQGRPQSDFHRFIKSFESSVYNPALAQGSQV